MHEEPALAVTHLTKSFHGRNAKDVLHDVTFALAPGECAGLVGVSGCGKSTTARIIAGLEAADSGTISLGAQTFDARQLGTRERFQHLAMVFQQPEASFDPRKTLDDGGIQPFLATQRRLAGEEHCHRQNRKKVGIGQQGFGGHSA